MDIFAYLLTGLLAILAKGIAIAIAILDGKSITILTAILFSKSVLQYYCNTFCNTPSWAWCTYIGPTKWQSVLTVDCIITNGSDDVLTLYEIRNLQLNRKLVRKHEKFISSLSHSRSTTWSANNETETKVYFISTRKHSWRKGYARQQCVYEAHWRRNLGSAGNPSLEPNITSIGKTVAKLWPFLYIQDGRQPPSWIFEIRKLHR